MAATANDIRLPHKRFWVAEEPPKKVTVRKGLENTFYKHVIKILSTL